MEKKMKRLTLIIVLLLLVGWTAGCGQQGGSSAINPPKSPTVSRISGSSAILSWEASADSVIAGYYVYRGATSETASLAKVGETLATKLTYADTALSSTEGYYYAVTVIIAVRQESAYTDRVYAAPYAASLPITISGIGGKK